MSEPSVLALPSQAPRSRGRRPRALASMLAAIAPGAELVRATSHNYSKEVPLLYLSDYIWRVVLGPVTFEFPASERESLRGRALRRLGA